MKKKTVLTYSVIYPDQLSVCLESLLCKVINMKFKRQNFFMSSGRCCALSQVRHGGGTVLASIGVRACPLVRRETFRCAAPPASSRATRVSASRGRLISPHAESAQEFLATGEKWITPEDFLLEENFSLF